MKTSKSVKIKQSFKSIERGTFLKQQLLFKVEDESSARSKQHCKLPENVEPNVGKKMIGEITDTFSTEAILGEVVPVYFRKVEVLHSEATTFTSYYLTKCAKRCKGIK